MAGGYVLLEEGRGAPPPAQAQKGKFVLMADGNPTEGFVENLKAGAGKTFSDLGLGVKQALDVPAKWLERTFDSRTSSGRPTSAIGRLGEWLGMPTAEASARGTQADINEARERDAPLMKTAGGVIGNIGGNVALTLPALAIPGASTYTGSTALGLLQGFLQPTADGESRLLNTTIGAVSGTAGKFVGDKVASTVANRLGAQEAHGAAQQSANATRDTTLTAGRDAGYVVPPTQANPKSAWNQILEGFSGKIKTAQAASVKNQDVTNRLARESLGIPADQPITPQTLKALRADAGQAYAAIEGGIFATDATFKKQLMKLSDAQRVLAEDIPELANQEVLALVKSLDKNTFDGRTLIEATKALREKATTAFRNGETDAGRFYRGASDEIEDMIERNLLYTGNGGEQAVKAFQEARKLIAKSYTVEGALNESTGNVIGAKLAAQLAKGKPLSGELGKAASFARAFPKATQEVEKSGASAISPLDFGGWGLASSLVGDPMMMAGVAARPVVRSTILSRPYQQAMTNQSYGPGGAMKLLDLMVNNEATKRLAPAAAASTGLQLAQ